MPRERIDTSHDPVTLRAVADAMESERKQAHSIALEARHGPQRDAVVASYWRGIDERLHGWMKRLRNRATRIENARRTALGSDE